MTRKFSDARREAFLAALAQSGNQTIAAERAKVSRAWVHLQRATDPAFREALAASVAAARVLLAEARLRGPEEGPDYHDGAELVVRGSNGRRRQIARARIKQWSPRAETRFLQALGATCNVKAACAEVGMTAAGAYAHRRRWPHFAQGWDEAVELGYVRVEMALLERAGNIFSPAQLPPETPIPEMTVAQAIQVLAMHKNAVRGLGKAPGRAQKPWDMEAIRASILRKIEAIERHRKKEAEMAALGAPGPAAWAPRHAGGDAGADGNAGGAD